MTEASVVIFFYTLDRWDGLKAAVVSVRNQTCPAGESSSLTTMRHSWSALDARSRVSLSHLIPTCVDVRRSHDGCRIVYRTVWADIGSSSRKIRRGVS